MAKNSMYGFQNQKAFVPIENKCLLTIKEAAQYSNIGENKLCELVLTPNCPFAFFVGKKKLIKRALFEQFIERSVAV